MRDSAITAVVICSIENLDPMGVHTAIPSRGADSDPDRPGIPAMRDEAYLHTSHRGGHGGTNIQFAVDPQTGERVVIEMNPRVSRSSALASKATGFPLAKIRRFWRSTTTWMNCRTTLPRKLRLL